MRCCFRVKPGNLNRRSGRADLGSLPDLSTVRQLPVLKPIPRDEAMLLCHQKREEIQLMLEQEQQRRRRTIVLRLGDLQVLAGFLTSTEHYRVVPAVRRPYVKHAMLYDISLQLLEISFLNATASMLLNVLVIVLL